MKKILILIIILLLIIILIKFNNKKENVDSVEPQILTNETIQTLASIYNKNNMIVTNLKVTGNLSVDNNLTGATNYVPIGTVVAWYNQAGDLTKIPEGWKICDGTNGTPDLRGRFILGQGLGVNLTNRKINERGGEENVTLTIEQIPKHTHSINFISAANGYDGDNSKPYPLIDHDNIDDINKRRSYNKETGEKGNNQSHNNMPPFYILAYIMRVS